MQSKPSMELASCKCFLGIYVMASCVCLIMENICDKILPIQLMIIKLARLLVTSSHWLDKILIVQDNFHLQWHHDQRIWSFYLRSRIFPAKIPHNNLNIFFMQIQNRPRWLLSYYIIARYHWLLFFVLILSFDLQ